MFGFHVHVVCTFFPLPHCLQDFSAPSISNQVAIQVDLLHDNATQHPSANKCNRVIIIVQACSVHPGLLKNQTSASSIAPIISTCGKSPVQFLVHTNYISNLLRVLMQMIGANIPPQVPWVSMQLSCRNSFARGGKVCGGWLASHKVTTGRRSSFIPSHSSLFPATESSLEHRNKST